MGFVQKHRAWSCSGQIADSGLFYGNKHRGRRWYASCFALSSSAELLPHEAVLLVDVVRDDKSIIRADVCTYGQVMFGLQLRRSLKCRLSGTDFEARELCCSSDR